MGPANPINPSGKTRSGSTRADVLHAFVVIECEGLQACDDCALDDACDLGRGIWPCQLRSVEARLGRSVDPTRPDDLAIGVALQLVGEQAAYEARDPESDINEAEVRGAIDAAARARLIREADREYLRAVLLEAMWLLMPRRFGSELTDAERDRLRELSAKEYDGLDNDEADEIYELRTRRWAVGHTQQNDALLDDLIAWSKSTGPEPQLPEWLEVEAENAVDTVTKRRRGELPRFRRRRTATGRPREPTFETASFPQQLGRLATERDPREIVRLVAELRRQAKQHNRLPPDHDRRHKPRD